MPYIWFSLDTVDLSASNVLAYFGLQLFLICPIFDKTDSSRFHIPLGYHCAWTQRPFIVFSKWGHTILLFYCSKSMIFYMNWILEQSLLFIIWQQYKLLTFKFCLLRDRWICSVLAIGWLMLLAFCWGIGWSLAFHWTIIWNTTKEICWRYYLLP